MGVLRMHWRKELAYTITPKSGPMRKMETLLDANRALSRDLPRDYLHRRHWLEAGNTLVDAAETGHPDAVSAATEKLLAAINAERWMTRGPLSERDYNLWQHQ
jgi:hypothetical protein